MKKKILHDHYNCDWSVRRIRSNDFESAKERQRKRLDNAMEDSKFQNQNGIQQSRDNSRTNKNNI